MSQTTSYRRFLPELALAAMVWMSFFAGLGKMDIWGRREQRLAAETADTLRGNWVIAHLAGKPRLEKPPLCRWLSAISVLATGRKDETALRLPYALGGLATVVMLYAWGWRLGRREIGLVAAVVFCTFTWSVAEIRQASADALLVPLVTGALWALWEASRRAAPVNRCLRVVSGLCTGLGILTKGPVALLFVLVAVATDAILSRRERSMWHALCDPLWWSAVVAASLPWPVLVIAAEPRAPLVWLYEMGLKLGAVPEPSEHRTLPMLLRYPELTIPWVPLAIAALVYPWVESSVTSEQKRSWWLIWGWAAGNLVVLSFWKIAKPSYYLPCLPGVALLSGIAWHGVLERVARGQVQLRQRLLVALQWGLFAVGGGGIVAAAWVLAPEWLRLALAIVGIACAAYSLSLARWSRADGLLWLGTGHAVLALALFTTVLPAYDLQNSHRQAAAVAERLRNQFRVPLLAMPHAEESLWFYMERPPRAVRDPDTVARIARRRGGALVIGDLRDLRRVQAHEALTVKRLHDESARDGRKGMVILYAQPIDPRVARQSE